MQQTVQPNGTVGGVTARRETRAEAAIAAALFVFALAVITVRVWHATDGPSRIAALTLFAMLTGTALSLSVAAWRERLRVALPPWYVRLLVPPLGIAAAIVLYSIGAGLDVAPRAVGFAAYLLVPAVALGVPKPKGDVPSPARVLVAAVALWLPIEFRVLPSLLTTPPPLVGLADGMYLCLVACPVERVGYTFRLRRHDVGLAVAATAAYAPLAIAIGMASGFLNWGPRITVVSTLVTPLAIYLVTAVPEEFLFRGLIQNSLTRVIGRAGLPVAAVIFGFAHLPDPRYVMLAALAGLAYGWVYERTGRITASAITHALVDWVWVVLLKG